MLANSKPKHPSPFLLFVKHQRVEIEQKIGSNVMKDILYQAGSEWSFLTEDQRQVFRDESNLLAAKSQIQAIA